MLKYDIILCECYDGEHQIIFKYDDDPDWENVYISYHLNKISLWGRIKYLFGFRSKYGAFGELILNGDDTTIEKFETIVDALKNIQRNQKLKELM